MNDLLKTVDIGSLTKGLSDNMSDLMEIWSRLPHRRAEYGKREIYDLVEVAFALGFLMRELNVLIDENQLQLAIDHAYTTH
jgi:hypothetical protein